MENAGRRLFVTECFQPPYGNASLQKSALRPEAGLGFFAGFGQVIAYEHAAPYSHRR
jgi:hypothetical protein